jgi:hypothetical protein
MKNIVGSLKKKEKNGEKNTQKIKDIVLANRNCGYYP